LAIGAMLIVGIPILPPVFVRILKILKIGKDDTGFQEHLQRFTFRSILVGMGLMSVLWILLGGSLWATILGLGIETGGLLEHLPRFVSATALAIVLGFAVPVSPGGLGIREAVLSILLIPYFQDILNIPANMSFTIQAETLAMLVSLVQRVVTILAELAIVAPLLFFPWLVRMVHSSTVEQPGESTAGQR
ncbi:MAG: hypothetical protein IKW74_06255, partial [Thermoguttaceae bacterium]|nr:hypothetical protein [Thermoguttaceae bacterium]